MYRPAEPVDWCQCCMKGVALTDAECEANLLGNDDSAEIIDPANNSGCFHTIFFSFSAADKAPCVKGAGRNLRFLTGGIVFVDTLQPLRHGFAVPPPFTQGRLFSPAIILQITLLVSANRGRLYRRIYFFKLL